MKYIYFFLLCVTLISCLNQDSEIFTENNVLLTKKSIEGPTLANAVNNGSFLRDFKVKADRTDLTGTEISIIRMASNLSAMSNNYVDIKTKLLEWATDDVSHSAVIQNVSLRYLRDFFLKQDLDSKNIKEISFLFKLLIDNNAVDIDVIADAYVILENKFTINEKEAYFSYIKTLHDSEVLYIRSKAEEFKLNYQNSADKYAENRFLLLGKDIEKRSEACKYVRELLDIKLI